MNEPLRRSLVPIVPFRFEHDATQRIIHVVFSGPYTDDDLQDSYYALKALTPDYGPANIILDFTKVSDIVVSHEAIRTHTYTSPILAPEWYLIAVAPRPVMYGIARMFELMSDDHPNMVVVHTVEEALEVLGAKSAHFSSLLEAA